MSVAPTAGPGRPWSAGSGLPSPGGPAGTRPGDGGGSCTRSSSQGNLSEGSDSFAVDGRARLSRACTSSCGDPESKRGGG